MPITFCKNCKDEFAYDFDLGLNVKYFEGEATATYFYGSGDFPCCPNCEARCVKAGNTANDIKIKTIFRPIKK